MTRRDLHWRLAGLPLFGAAAALGLAANASLAESQIGGAIGVLAFVLYMGGMVLVMQGEQLPKAWSNRRTDRPRPVIKAYSRLKREGGRRARH